MTAASFVLSGNAVLEERLGLKVTEEIGPEYASDFVMRGINEASAPGSEFVRADIVRECEGDVLRLIVGGRFSAGPDQRLVDRTGLTTHGDMARLLLAALKAMLLLKWSDRGAERVRIEAAGKLATILKPALPGHATGDTMVVGERAIEPDQLAR